MLADKPSLKDKAYQDYLRRERADIVASNLEVKLAWLCLGILLLAWLDIAFQIISFAFPYFLKGVTCYLLNFGIKAKQSLIVQDACNLSGVILSMDGARQIILNNGGGREKGTHWLNYHPIMQMYASKIHDLTGMGLSDSKAFQKAYDLVTRMAAGEDCY